MKQNPDTGRLLGGPELFEYKLDPGFYPAIGMRIPAGWYNAGVLFFHFEKEDIPALLEFAGKVRRRYGN